MCLLNSDLKFCLVTDFFAGFYPCRNISFMQENK
jgi:hypothetical protein